MISMYCVPNIRASGRPYIPKVIAFSYRVYVELLHSTLTIFLVKHAGVFLFSDSTAYNTFDLLPCF